MPLDEDAALTLAGPDPHDVDSARDVEPVTQADVEAAEKAAEQADANATRTEYTALAGQTAPAQAAADREASRYANLRLAVTRRRAERHAAAQRILGLHQVGEDAVRHAGELKALRERIAEREAKIAELQAANHDDIAGWSAELAAIAARGRELAPEPVPPSGRPPASSASVWAGVVDTRPLVNVDGRVISGVRLDHPHGIDTALDEADRQTARHDPGTRLFVAENGLVLPVGRDEYGHIQQRINRGELRELTLPERERYWRGEAS